MTQEPHSSRPSLHLQLTKGPRSSKHKSAIVIASEYQWIHLSTFMDTPNFSQPRPSRPYHKEASDCHKPNCDWDESLGRIRPNCLIDSLVKPSHIDLPLIHRVRLGKVPSRYLMPQKVAERFPALLDVHDQQFLRRYKSASSSATTIRTIRPQVNSSAKCSPLDLLDVILIPLDALLSPVLHILNEDVISWIVLG